MTTFNIEWGGSADLTTADIWPDGDAPENPTTEDVKAAMLKSSYDVSSLVRDWCLDVEEIEVFGPGGHVSLTNRTFREARRSSASEQFLSCEEDH